MNYICDKCGRTHDGSYSERFCSVHCRQSYIASKSHTHRKDETTVISCAQCGKQIEVKINYWHTDLCKECRDKSRKERALQKEIPLVKGVCKFCGQPFERQTRNITTQFCCDNHAKRYASNYNKEETRKKISNALKGKTHTIKCFLCGKELIVLLSLNKKLCSDCKKNYRGHVDYCVICGKPTINGRKTCSPECKEKARVLSFQKTQSIHHNCGGYREGTGKAKSGYYKGFYCGSTYELVWLIYQLDHGKDVQRFPGMLQWNGIKYIPDFLQNGKIIELKGYWQKNVDKKCEVACHYGYDIVVLYRDDLEKEFMWVKDHYQYKHVEELYDGYKPKFKLTCSHCQKIFYRNTSPKTKEVFCSCRCAGLERAYQNHHKK